VGAAESKSNDAPRLTIQGKRYIAREIFHNFLHLGVLLLAAGDPFWINAWVCAGLGLLGTAATDVFLYKYNRDLLNRRGQVIQEGTKRFDKVFVAIYIPIALIVSIISGLDAVRYGWAPLPLWTAFVGGAIYLLVFPLGIWAMSVNRHFEATVIIKGAHEHKVCSEGPYRYVRHPGYLAAILGAVGYPLILQSFWGLVATLALVLVFVTRTAFEDRALREELDGYKEFAASTRYRLIPFIW